MARLCVIAEGERARGLQLILGRRSHVALPRSSRIDQESWDWHAASGVFAGIVPLTLSYRSKTTNQQILAVILGHSMVTSPRVGCLPNEQIHFNGCVVAAM